MHFLTSWKNKWIRFLARWWTITRSVRWQPLATIHSCNCLSLLVMWLADLINLRANTAGNFYYGIGQTPPLSKGIGEHKPRLNCVGFLPVALALSNSGHLLWYSKYEHHVNVLVFYLTRFIHNLKTVARPCQGSWKYVECLAVSTKVGTIPNIRYYVACDDPKCPVKNQ